MHVRSLSALFLASVVVTGCQVRLSDNKQLPVTPPPAVVAPGRVAVMGQELTITNLSTGQTVSSPLDVTGSASRSDLPLFVVIGDESGRILGLWQRESTTTPLYSAQVSFGRPLTPGGAVEVFYMTNNGPADTIRIPVRFAFAEPAAINLYFGSSVKDPEALYCSKVYPVARLGTLASSTPEVVMRALLAGPNPDELATGVFTSLPTSTLAVFDSFTVGTSTISIDFSKKFDLAIAGSCRVAAVRAQIEQTMRQFGGIQQVRILVDGSEAEALQP